MAWRRLNHAMRNETRFRLVWQQEDVDPQGFLADSKWFIGGTVQGGHTYRGCFDHDRMFTQLPDKPGRPIVSALCVDPSASRYWAVLHILVYQDGDQVLFQGLRRAMAAPELLYRDDDGTFTGVLEDFWQQASAKGVAPRWLVIETNAAQRYLKQYPFFHQWKNARAVVDVPHQTNRSNKADEDLGPQVLKPVYREGKLRLPYSGYQEKLFADQFMREACAWPEGSTDDIVMAHWMLNLKLPVLQIAIGEENEREPVEAPSWARVRQPSWANRSMARVS